MTSIVNNAASVNAHRNLGITSMKMGKVLEKLSSGFRINRAADDAAGLGISEKMRAQIRGNSQAIRNANDGISMIQTAEGAMDEVHSILQRVRELGVQAANDTYDTAARDSIATEINQLRTEIDRIGNSTQFNGQKLLTGNLAGSVSVTGGTLAVGSSVMESAVGGNAATNVVNGSRLGDATNGADIGAVTLTNEAARAINPGDLTFAYNAGTNELSLSGAGFTGAPVTLANQGTGNLTFTDAGTGAAITVNLAALDGTYGAGNGTSDDLIGAALDTQTLALVNDGTNAASVSGIAAGSQAAAGTYTFSQIGPDTIRLSNGAVQQDIDLSVAFAAEVATGGSSTLDFNNLGITINLSNQSGNAVDSKSVMADFVGQTVIVAGSGQGATLQVGANVTADDQLSINFNDTRASSVNGLNLTNQTVTAAAVTGLSADVAVDFSQVTGATGIVGSNDRAQALVSLVDTAITTLNTRRATLGALQNRLESTVNSLGVAVENLTASESRIRDADVAKLSSQLVSNQILQQAGTSVLSQANQMPQAIAQLLRG